MRWADTGSPLLRLSVPSMRNARSAIFQPDPVPHERLGGLIARAFFLPGGPIFVRPNIFSPHCFFGPEAVIERIEDKIRLNRHCAEDDDNERPFHGSPRKSSAEQ